MLKIYDLYEGYNEAQIDNYIEQRKDIPLGRLSHGYNVNDVIIDDPSNGSYYLAEDDRCVVWWFGPRNTRGVAGRNDYGWFCFRTEDGVYHKFEVTNIERANAARDKILEWIARGIATDGPELNVATEVEFMDI